MIAIKRFYLVFVQYNHQIETNLIKKKTTIPLFRDRFVFTDDRLFFLHRVDVASQLFAASKSTSRWFRLAERSGIASGADL